MTVKEKYTNVKTLIHQRSGDIYINKFITPATKKIERRCIHLRFNVP